MGKTYKFTLPQNKEVENTNVRVENGEVLVEVEFKEKFEPKDGDFLSTEDGRVFIYNSRYTSVQYGAYCGVDIYNNLIISDSPLLPGWTGKKGCRYATPEEKADFLKRLEGEKHLRWNAEKKCLEDIRWRAEDGDEYFYVGFDYIVRNRIDERQVSANENYRNHNYFRTFEAAQKVADQIKEILKNSKAE